MSSRMSVARVVVHLDCKPKDKSISNILESYEDRLKPRGITLQTHHTRGNISDYESEISNLSGNIVIIDQGGEVVTSEELANWIKSIKLENVTTHLIVGPHSGLSKKLKEEAGSMISLSRLTLTHEMAAILLMEQLYRATEINKGTSYHRN